MRARLGVTEQTKHPTTSPRPPAQGSPHPLLLSAGLGRAPGSARLPQVQARLSQELLGATATETVHGGTSFSFQQEPVKPGRWLRRERLFPQGWCRVGRQTQQPPVQGGGAGRPSAQHWEAARVMERRGDWPGAHELARHGQAGAQRGPGPAPGVSSCTSEFSPLGPEVRLRAVPMTAL